MLRSRLSQATAALALVAVSCAEVLGIGEIDVVIPALPGPPAPEGGTTRPDTGAAEAGIPEAGAPPDGEAGLPGKRVFVTSTFVTGSIGGIQGGDDRCFAAATRAGLGGNWIAWLGGERPPADRIPHDGPFVLVRSRKVIAKAKAALLVSPIGGAIDEMEDGAQVVGDEVRVWTGTRGDGKVGLTCGGWTSNSPPPVTSGTMGFAEQPTNGSWLDNGGQGIPFVDGWSCATEARIYCFEL